MLHLLKIEWLKVKNYRTFWILAALFLISIFGINYIVYYVQSTSIPKNDQMVKSIIGTPPFQFPEVWQTVTFITGFLLFIPGLLIIISITNEYSFKTHRQNIIDGLTRTQFILVKMMLVVIIGIISTIITALTALVFGLIEGNAGFSLVNFDYVGDFFVQTISFGGIALLFGVLFKRSGIAIGVYFLFIAVIERMLAAVCNHYFAGVGDYFPLRSSSNLIPFPFFRKIVGGLIHNPETLYLLIASCIYLAIYFFITKRKFETDDL
jgi:hypothetical protein